MYTQEWVPYSGKFSRGPNFRDFRYPRPKRENKNRENCTREKFSHVRFVHQSRCLTMALHRYFKPSDDLLPSPTGLFRPL